MASNRSCAVVAKSGRTRVRFIKTAGRKMGYSGSVKNARVNMPASVTTGLGKLGEKTSDMKTVIGKFAVSMRSCAATANSGRMRVSIVENTSRKTGYHCGAKNVGVRITSGLGKLGEGTSDMKTVIGSLMESKRSFAERAKDGKARLSFTKTSGEKTA